MATSLRWGILGTGNIARQFVSGLKTSQRGRVTAVGSRGVPHATRFIADNGLSALAQSYDELITNPDVDSVYVSLPNSLHHEWTIKALRAGKHVLCEKPIAANAAQAREMFDEAARCGRVLAEAFMYRSHPMMISALHAAHAGEIGAIRLIRASFCYRTQRIAGNIRFDRALAGGALMDVGCYCVNFARAVCRAEPSSISAMGHLHESGVDDLVAGTLRFAGDVIATFTCGMNVQADNTAYICGSEGYIEIPIPWKPPTQSARYRVARQMPPKMDLAEGNSKAPPGPEERRFDSAVELFGLEAEDFAATVFDGAPARVTAADSIGNMQVLDALLKQIHSDHP